MTLQKAKLQQSQHYNDDLQYFDHPHPTGAPRWAYIDQTNILFNTDIEQMKSGEEYISEKNETARCSVTNTKQNESDSNYLKMVE